MRSLILAAALFASLGFTPQTPEPVTFRLKLAPQQPIRYKSHTAIGQEIAGQDGSITIDMTLNYTPTSDSKGSKVQLGFSDVSMKMPESIPFSADDAAKSIETLKLTAIFDELGVSSDLSVEGDNMSKMLMGQTGGVGMGFLGLQYPTDPVKVGDSWKVEFDLSKAMAAFNGGDPDKKASVPVTYTLTKVENGVASVTAKTKAKMDVQGMGGMQMTIDMDTESQFAIDVATGLPKTVSTKGHNAIDAAGMTIDQKIESTMTRL